MSLVVDLIPPPWVMFFIVIVIIIIRVVIPRCVDELFCTLSEDYTVTFHIRDV